MPMLFETAEKVLYHSSIHEKIELTESAWQSVLSDRFFLDAGRPIRPASEVVFPERPELLAPKQMLRRSLNTPAGKAAFFHALSHIEFVAVYLAWDIIYRFRGLPEDFYRDWLKVAYEESQHFQLLRQHLQQSGVDYGDLPAHRGLWDHAVDTEADLLARLAIVPRCMEARGLDVTPAMIEKFRQQQDTASVSILTRILDDEIGHVKTGSDWFKYFCQQQGKEFQSAYRELLAQYFIGTPKGPFNREMRIIAGFTSDEIDWLEQRA